MSDLANKILQRIDEEQIKPVPGWKFSAKNGLFWTSWIVSVLVGSVAVSAGIFVMANAGWQYYEATHENLVTFFVESLPYLWILVLGGFIFFGYENFRHTKRGYQFRFVSILILSIGTSMAAGSVLYFVGVGQIFDQHVAAGIPFHQPVVEYQQELWERPEKGLLAGEVKNISEDYNWFTLSTFKGEEWTVYTSELSEPDFNTLSEFSQVRVIGLIDSDNTSNELVACIIFPWEVYGAPPSGDSSRRDYPTHYTIGCTTPDCEIKPIEERNTKCKDVRPYSKLNIISE